MKIEIGYFAASSALGPAAVLQAGAGEFANAEEALNLAKLEADKVDAYSFILHFPDGSRQRWIRQPYGWAEEEGG
jgi:hypothetical protein